ncbi:uncharacterized protein G2W53_032721 [Senna tora]|uniref:Uncharacterized protein n=1 Tax=Senna tora TaxID=362788 RepID=A0A834W6J6_9FABA|nr:uncharacterized protein G2W53_032721 [Senna tora]
MALLGKSKKLAKMGEDDWNEMDYYKALTAIQLNLYNDVLFN